MAGCRTPPRPSPVSRTSPATPGPASRGPWRGARRSRGGAKEQAPRARGRPRGGPAPRRGRAGREGTRCGRSPQRRTERKREAAPFESMGRMVVSSAPGVSSGESMKKTERGMTPGIAIPMESKPEVAQRYSSHAWRRRAASRRASSRRRSARRRAAAEMVRRRGRRDMEGEEWEVESAGMRVQRPRRAGAGWRKLVNRLDGNGQMNRNRR